MSLAETAEARKEKILALRRRKAGEDATTDANGTTTRPRPSEFKFRNYEPSSSSAPTINETEVDEEDTVEKTVKGVMEKAQVDDAARRLAELDLTSIQPKRPNWDLKRDLNKKLEKLEPATRAATATLIRRRMLAQGVSTEKGAADLALQVAMESGATGAQDDSSDDDD